jgi:hypothetical protein
LEVISPVRFIGGPIVCGIVVVVVVEVVVLVVVVVVVVGVFGETPSNVKSVTIS